MKVTREKMGFKPVNIILETKEEVDYLYTIMASISGYGPLRDFSDTIFYELNDIHESVLDRTELVKQEMYVDEEDEDD